MNMIKNQKGFSLIEVVVAVIILSTVVSVVSHIVNYIANGANSSVSIGLNGISETRCIGGYKFVVGEGGQSRQILNEQGGGIPCN